MTTFVVTDTAGWTELGSGNLPASGVTAGTYGDSTHVGQFTVNAAGQVTAASDVAISGGGGTSGLVQLFDSTLGANAASIDTGAAGVAAGHGHLIIQIIARCTAAGVGVDSLVMRINNDSAAHYNYIWMRNAGGTLGSVSGFAQTQIGLGQMPGAAATASYFSPLTIHIPSYDQTTAFKAGTCMTGPAEDTLVNSQFVFSTFSWASTAAITRLAIFPTDGSNMLAGSRMTVYGTQ